MKIETEKGLKTMQNDALEFPEPKCASATKGKPRMEIMQKGIVPEGSQQVVGR